MQLYKKVSCTTCPHYAECSRETKMYINYCGSQSSIINRSFLKALKECRMRRGHFLTRILVKQIPRIPKKQVAGPSIPA